MNNKILYFFKFLSFLFCIALFCWLMSDIYDKFSKKQTTIAITVEENRNEEKNLPCFTVCPWNIFKNYGFHYKLRDFAMNSYEINVVKTS